MDELFKVECCPECGYAVSVVLHTAKKKTAHIDITIVCGTCKKGHRYNVRVTDKNKLTGKREANYSGIIKGLKRVINSWNEEAVSTKRKSEVNQLE